MDHNTFLFDNDGIVKKFITFVFGFIKFTQIRVIGKIP